MVQLSNTVAQTIQPGGSVIFDKIIIREGCDTCFTPQLPTSVKLKAGKDYIVHFHGNVTDTPAAAGQLALAIADQAIPYTAMNFTPTAAGALVNVSTSTPIKNCCCDANRISVKNTGTVPITLAPNSNFYIVRKECC